MSDERAPRPVGGRRGRATRPRHPGRPCLNCGDPTYGEYCPTCGQRKVDVQVSVRAMVMDVLEDELILGHRLPRTMLALLFKPGVLTVEVVNGRIARNVRPFKLYLVSSVLFFLILSFVSLRALERVPMGEPGDPRQAAAERLAGVDSSLAAVDSAMAAADLAPRELAALQATRSRLEGERDRLASRAGAVEAASVDTAAVAADPARPRDDDQPLQFLANATVRTGIERADSAILVRLRRLSRMQPREASQEMARTFLSYVPTTLFLLLPLFAGVLKLLYIRRGRFYAEHFVFLLHTHAFIFAIFTLMLLFRSWLTGWIVALLVLWVFSYIYIAMLRVYGQGWFKTLVKYWTLGWMYFFILTFTIPVLIVATLLLLPG